MLSLKMPRAVRAAGIVGLLLTLGSGSVFAQNTLHTWIGGASTVWTNAANWSDGIVPLTTNDDALVDNNPAQSSVAVYTVTNGAAISNGTLTVDLGDAVTFAKENVQGGATLYFDGSLNNAGTFTIGGSGSGTSHGSSLYVTFARAGVDLNATSGVIYAKSLTGYRRNSVTLNVPAATTNSGTIRVQNISGQGGGKIRLILSGGSSPVFVNNGLVSLEGSGSDNGAGGNQPWAAMGPGTSGAALTLAGTGTLSLRSNLSHQPDSFAVFAGMTSGTSLTNAADHTIQGNGYIGLNIQDGSTGNTISAFKFTTLVNQGLIQAVGSASNTWLQIEPNGGTIVNAAGGRMVARLGTGTVMRVGGNVTPTSFTNNGLLEARTGTLVSIGTATVMRINGELRGGGTFAVATNLSLSASATLAPGDSAAEDGTGDSLVGAVAVTGNLALASSTLLNVQLGAPATAGVDYDTVNVSGTLTLDGTLTIEMLPGFRRLGSYRLFTFQPGAENLTDNGLSVPNDYHLAVNTEAGTVDLVGNPPGTMVLFN
jgi:hypothetical protein